MPNESHLWLPSHLRPARKKISVVFYKWKIGETIRYTVGAPVDYPAPRGAEKIVCETATEVDKYDRILREQERADHEMTEEERYEFEAPIRKYLREDLYNRMVNSKNTINREFCRMALAKMDEYEAKNKERKESVQHIVAFEDGK
jgi:hypothetical protein